MESTHFNILAEQYKQFRAKLQSFMPVVPLDTITTRFLLLFLFLLSIPLVTVILFTTSLLANHLDDSANSQLALSQNLFEASLDRQKSNLRQVVATAPLRPQAFYTYRQLCGETPVGACLLIDSARQQVTINAETRLPVAEFNAQAPDLARVALSGMPQQSFFFARWQDRLFLFARRPMPATHQVVLQGEPVDESLLNWIFRQQPTLQTDIWILKTAAPETGQETGQNLWYAQSTGHPHSILASQLLGRLQATPWNKPLDVELNKSRYRVLQQPIYSVNHQPIARIAYVLPLNRNQLLLQNYYLGIYIITVASLIFSVLLAMIAGRSITQPLLKLIHQVNQTSRENVMRDSDEIRVVGVYEINQLVDAFNRMIKRLRQEHKMKDEFVATLTHDLKVPMLAEKQTLSYLRTETYGPLTPEQAEVLDILQSSNRSCLSLVNGLLEVYRYESGEVSLMFERFNLASLLDETAGELQSLAREKNINLTVQHEVSEQPDSALAYADRLEIKRVLSNLISNAIINTRMQGDILCRILDAQHYGNETVYKVSGFQRTTLKYPVQLTNRLLVVIQDSGVGFTDEDLPFLFKQFAASRGRNPMSIGLGLYNCHQVVQAHHGALWVETTEGEGSAVCFVLPGNQQVAQDRRIYRDRRKRD